MNVNYIYTSESLVIQTAYSMLKIQEQKSLVKVIDFIAMAEVCHHFPSDPNSISARPP